MAIGKNKRLTKGKKGQKKKTVDPFTKKQWKDIKAPSVFGIRNCAKTLVSKTQGTKISSESLKGRVCEVNLADLNKDEEQGHKNMKLCIEDTQGNSCLTEFHGMAYTRDKLCSLIKKWQTLINATADVKTQDGYVVRLFLIGFTNRQREQVKSNCYAQSGKVRRIRSRAIDTMKNEVEKGSLRDLVKKLIPGAIEKEVQKKCSSIFPLKEVHVFKVKVMKKPKFDVTRLMEAHEGGAADIGEIVPDDAKNTITAEM